jgi:flagellin-like protein
MQKKGVSAVVATILIVMITVAAVGLIWMFVLPMVQRSLSVDDACKNADLNIENDGYTCYVENNFTSVQIKKGNSDVDIIGVDIIISSDGNSQSYPTDFQFIRGEEKVFSINTPTISKVESIGVAAVVKRGNEKKTCSVVYLQDIKKCSLGVLPEENFINDELDIPFESCTTNAQGFYAGAGTSGSPYQICNWNQLSNIRNKLSASYKLITNIDSDTEGYYGQEDVDASMGGWLPIGNSTNPFTGTFDGGGYTIDGVYMNYDDRDGVGLFGFTTNAIISNVGLTGFRYSSLARYGNVNQKYFGGLVGKQSGGLINNSYVKGTFEGGGREDYLGGVVGHSTGNITNSYSDVYIGSTNDFIGGLVGYSSGVIEKSYSKRNVLEVANNYIGGLAGQLFGGKIVSSYSEMDIKVGVQFVGGLVGRNDGAVLKSYYSGNISSEYYLTMVGGIVGYNIGTIENCYSVGNIEGNEIGGVAGNSEGTIKNCYSTAKITGNVINGYTLAGGLVGNGRPAINSFADNIVISEVGDAGGLFGSIYDATPSNVYWRNTTNNPNVCYYEYQEGVPTGSNVGCTLVTNSNEFYNVDLGFTSGSKDGLYKYKNGTYIWPEDVWSWSASNYPQLK